MSFFSYVLWGRWMKKPPERLDDITAELTKIGYSKKAIQEILKWISPTN